MRNQEILNEINSILTNVCDDEQLKYHIIPVVNNAKELAGYFNAKMEIVELSAYLHDITKITGDRDKHHITGAEYAENLLNKYDIPMDVIQHVKKCIFNHRASIDNPRETIEEKIVATADAMAGIQYPLPIFHTWYGKKKCNLRDGADEIKKKLDKSWKKLSFHM